MKKFIKKKFKIFFAAIVCVGMLFCNMTVIYAAGESGILGNGTSGIYININTYPYTYYKNVPTWGKYAYTKEGCAWFATSRATQITGKQFPTIYSGYSWYNTQYANYGFSRGSTIRAGALACYENHIAVVEKIEGNQAVISEGGYTGTDSAHGFTVIRKRNISDMGSANAGGKLLGYVYLSNTPVSVSFNWVNERCEYDTTNAFIYAEAKTNVSGSFTRAGFTLWDEKGNVVASKSENPAHTGTSLEIWYNVTNETGVVLKENTNYKYQIYTTFNGKEYRTGIKSFRTRTSGPVENSWTENLDIDNWIYGMSAQTPTAKAKYGTPTFTYSTEENGTYTSKVPTDPGTYYVKATVKATKQYTEITAIKRFHIWKATPEYTIPENISMIYGQRLEEVSLPDGFAWMHDTELSGSVGEKIASAYYTPKDTAHYNVIRGIRIPITVKPKNLSNIQLMGIDKNTDLNEYKISDGDTVLKKDTDYIISTVTNNNVVTISVKFIGNYTGITQTTYSLGNVDKEPTHQDENKKPTNSSTNTDKEPTHQDENKKPTNSSTNTDKKLIYQNKNTKTTSSSFDKTTKSNKQSTNKSNSPKTGDNINYDLYALMFVISGLSIVILAVLKKRKA